MLSQTYFTQEASSFQLPLEKGQTPGLMIIRVSYSLASLVLLAGVLSDLASVLASALISVSLGFSDLLELESFCPEGDLWSVA